MLVVAEFVGCSPSLSGAIRVNPWSIEAVSRLGGCGWGLGGGSCPFGGQLAVPLPAACCLLPAACCLLARADCPAPRPRLRHCRCATPFTRRSACRWWTAISGTKSIGSTSATTRCSSGQRCGRGDSSRMWEAAVGEPLRVPKLPVPHLPRQYFAVRNPRNSVLPCPRTAPYTPAAVVHHRPAALHQEPRQAAVLRPRLCARHLPHGRPDLQLPQAAVRRGCQGLPAVRVIAPSRHLAAAVAAAKVCRELHLPSGCSWRTAAQASCCLHSSTPKPLRAAAATACMQRPQAHVPA